MSILYAQISFGSSGQSQTFLPGVPTGQRLGWLQFQWGQYGGILHALNFANSIVFPEAQGPTGGTIYCPAGFNWSVATKEDPVNGWSIENESGLVNLALNEISHLTSGAPGRSLDVPAGLGTDVSVPFVGAAGETEMTASKLVGTTNSFYSGLCEINGLLAVLGFASEIAQAACNFNSAETYESFGPYTGSQLVAPTSGVPRSAQIYIAAPPTRSDCKFGATGALMLGHFCWEYSGFYGPLKYLNSGSIYGVPEDSSVTGLQLYLKPGVSATVELGINEFATTAIVTSLGKISLVAGAVSGFVPNPI